LFFISRSIASFIMCKDKPKEGCIHCSRIVDVSGKSWEKVETVNCGGGGGRKSRLFVGSLFAPLSRPPDKGKVEYSTLIQKIKIGRTLSQAAASGHRKYRA
jgi:hypothetical protein